MKIVEKKQNDIQIFKINGRLDSNTSPELEDKIFGAIKNESLSSIPLCCLNKTDVIGFFSSLWTQRKRSSVLEAGGSG